jgi:hypothetical protein
MYLYFTQVHLFGKTLYFYFTTFKAKIITFHFFTFTETLVPFLFLIKYQNVNIATITNQRQRPARDYLLKLTTGVVLIVELQSHAGAGSTRWCGH